MRTPAPMLGEHTDAVLRELLGLDAEAIAALRAGGAIGPKHGNRDPTDRGPSV